MGEPKHPKVLSSDYLDRLEEAFDIADEFRACHSYPLMKAAVGLRSTVSRQTGGDAPQVSQRLKRFPTILSKLQREDKLKLGRMQDIGGCRAILPDIDACYRVHKRLLKRVGFDRYVDYIQNPRDSGYRGIHVILKYDERRIEVQLRTRTMHDWAIAVERLGFRMGDDLKSGAGSAEVKVWLALISEAMAIEEVGDAVSKDMLERIHAARQDALPFLP